MKNENPHELEVIKRLKNQKLKVTDITSYVKVYEVDVNKIDRMGYNILHYAIKSDVPDVVNLFLNPSDEYKIKPADPNITTQDEAKNIFLPPMMLALLHSNDDSASYKIIKYLLKAGSDHKLKDYSDCNIIHRATEKGRRDVLDLILNSDQTCDLNSISKFGPPIHFAITSEQDEIVQYLLDKKVNLKIRDKAGNTVLHHSIRLSLYNIFKLIHDHIIDSTDLSNEEKKEIINAVNEDHNTIFHELALKKSFTLISILKKSKEEFRVDEKIKNKDGFDYNEAFQNLLNNENIIKQNEIERKNLIKKEKEKLLEEKYKMEEEERREEERLQKDEERRREIGLKLLKYRGWIFGIVALFFFGVILLIIKNASKKKDFII